jgi:hypothetical protein
MDRTVSVTRPGPRHLRASLPHLALLASLPLLGDSPLRAAPEPPPFPPSAEFRSLQLITLACSRENTAESCDKARSLANPLLDCDQLLVLKRRFPNPPAARRAPTPCQRR